MIYGAKKGSKGQQKPNIAKDTTASTNYFQGLYGLSEGEVFGLVDGGKSIKLDGTPLINDNGQPNFENVSWEFRNGTIDQEHIKGFSSVENEQSVGVELRHDRPFTRAISNTQLSAVVIRLNWGALREQKDNGDIVGYKIDYAIDVQTDGGAWATVLNTTINDKASQGYQRSHRIDLPNARRGWTVRVRRITPNRDNDLIADTMSVQAITEVIDAKLRYPCTSLLALKYDAQTFGNVAKVAVRMRGMIVQVPSNYNAQTRTYTGVWDGTFKPAYTNNPAWVFYDLCTATRYGLGDRLAGKVDKWSLYALGQYCDELVDDGMGGKEPRFTVNVYIQKAQDAYQVLQSLASVFRAMSYWDGMQIIVDADTPKEPVYTFTNANVVNGAFSYTGTRKRDRHTIAKVAYDDPDNEFKTDYVHVRDEFAIAKYGISIIDINAFGCTSRAQAYRAGAWALQSEQLETETVTFSAGLDGFIPKVGEVINVSDNARAGRANGGRVVSASGRTVTLDRTAGKVGDTFVINGTDGQAKTAKITAIRGVVITLDKVVGAVSGAVWAMTSSDLAPRQFRVMSIRQNDDNTFGITGLQYEPSKFSASDNGAHTIARPVSVIKPQVLATPSNIVITGHNRVVQGQAVATLTINWAQVVGAVGYIVEWRKGDNAWQTLPTIASQSIDIDGVYAGNYQARVRAVDAFDNESLATTSQLTTIKGKTGKPPKLYLLKVQGGLFSMQLDWIFNHGSEDTNYTEIQVSPDGQANIATLAVFSYPTNSHTITGLQGNLTQFYRARIVDKLGNASDWTAWVRGTTSSDAAKVLELISGQISESHLDQALREPIAKIDAFDDKFADFDGKFNGIDGKINLFNAKIPSIEQAVQQTNARLPQLNRSIDELMRDKTAKSQEIANIRQKVGDTTTQIRDVFASTDNLTRRFGEMTVSQQRNQDTLNARMQTVQDSIVGAEQAINQMRETMNAKFSSLSDNLLVGGDETKVSTDWDITYPIKEQLSAGQKVQITLKNAQNLTSVAVYNSSASGSAKIGDLRQVGDEWVGEFAWVAYGANNELRLYRQPRYSRQSVQAVLAKHTDTTALIDEVKQSIATKEQALSERIGQIDTAYKQADRTANASIQQLERSLTDKERSLSERIGQLSTQIRQPNGQYATATALDEVKSSVRQIDGKLTSEVGKISTLQSTVNGQTTSIRNVEQSFNGVRTIKAVTVDNNGFISGYGLMSELQNGQVTSRFGINADQIYFGATTSAKKPFVFTTRPTTIDGVSYPAGAWFNSAHIANASITNAHIANGSIDNAKIANASIDSVKIRNGSVGSLQLQDGSVTSAKIGHLAVDTLNIANEAIIVPRALNSGFKQWNGEIEDEVIFAATMNSEQAPVVINLYARVSGAKISDRYNAYSSPPRINLVATHISSGEKEWILGYGEKNPPSFNRFVMSGYMSETGGNNNGHYFNGSGTAGYFGITREINRNTLLFLPKYSGEYRFELTLTLKGNVRARLYEASMLLMAVKR
ncbi:MULTISPECIES: phage tail protein [unclassified Moraxella]|uniref:TipJ family phage tail tip protein n=3 Tax=Moraxella TaxID=475 RepID=UPI002B402D1D|nr:MULTISPECIES: phage tail protein [unclassified Moraxella]